MERRNLKSKATPIQMEISKRAKNIIANIGLGNSSQLERIQGIHSLSILEEGTSQTSNQLIQNPKSFRRRGKNKCKVIVVESCKRRPLNFNIKGQPIGEYSVFFSTYIGVIVREIVPITILTWHKVKPDVKDSLCLWEQKFIVPEEAQKLTLMSMGKDWREFKVEKRKLIDINDEYEQALKNYLEDVPYNQWEAFVKQCTTSNYKDKIDEINSNNQDVGDDDLTEVLGPEYPGRNAQDEITPRENSILLSEVPPLDVPELLTYFVEQASPLFDMLGFNRVSAWEEAPFNSKGGNHIPGRASSSLGMVTELLQEVLSALTSNGLLLELGQKTSLLHSRTHFGLEASQFGINPLATPKRIHLNRGWIEVSAKNKSTEKELVDLSSRHGYRAYALADAVAIVQRRSTYTEFFNSFRPAYCETDKSRWVFDECPQCRDVLTWNMILATYAGDERIDVMEDLFEEMPERDVIWWSTMIMGLIDMYAKSRCIEISKKVFSEIPRSDVWEWNVMISGWAMHGFGKEAV
ncbi:hypothetical protein GIB67_029117 [Kingdonia uniflora]|uniref:Pentatricopeptide repeat-containing protein n=1 Tax=Kingdonia uniflora TaxID=39325 RepID=A0A7J7N7G7_9MAGN|nr:hypothetical protein GIB67_029117 [Kingdonia uniflora]